MKDFVEDAKDFRILPEKNRSPSREMVYQTCKYFRAITLAAEWTQRSFAEIEVKEDSGQEEGSSNTYGKRKMDLGVQGQKDKMSNPGSNAF